MKKTICFVFLLCLSFSFAQDVNDAWKSSLENISSQNVIKMMITSEDGVKKVDLKCLPAILNACKETQALDGPDCRCLPVLKGRLVVFLKENLLFTVELVENHWFHASYLHQGRVVPFILKDKENRLFKAAYSLEEKGEKAEKCPKKCCK